MKKEQFRQLAVYITWSVQSWTTTTIFSYLLFENKCLQLLTTVRSRHFPRFKVRYLISDTTYQLLAKTRVFLPNSFASYLKQISGQFSNENFPRKNVNEAAIQRRPTDSSRFRLQSHQYFCFYPDFVLHSCSPNTEVTNASFIDHLYVDLNSHYLCTQSHLQY